ncbi:MAG: hypothetical protein COA78_03335 [Blastopirellula sp.]|nr:MAG: hypothetical protein COA78_03335 [Blastopirellula sp.]
MQSIDFLPEKYKQRRIRKRVGFLRIGIFSIIVLCVCGTALFQLVRLGSLKLEIASLEAEYSKVTEIQKNILELESKNQTQINQAQLLTFLRHPWPSSQIMSLVAETKTESLYFNEMRVFRQSETKKKALFPEDKDTNKDKLPAAVQDLLELQKDLRGKEIVINISGICNDTTQLYDYLSKLNQSDLVHRAIVDSVEPITGISDIQNSRFEIIVYLNTDADNSANATNHQVATLSNAKEI